MIPSTCPICNSSLIKDDYGLVCNNKSASPYGHYVYYEGSNREYSYFI